LLADLADAGALERALRASEEFAAQQEVVGELSRMRREALEELVAQGLTHQQIADKIGILSRARVGQLLSSGPKPERALLGTGALTVAVGGKPEAEPRTDTPNAMISEGMYLAYQAIADTADAYGLKTTQEIIHPGQVVDLNRPNLIVMGSPRVMAVVGQSLAADDHLGFGNDAHGWYLTEQDGERRIYRSPRDNGEWSDYGYIGRLPRPDTKGTFLYIAGIHAPGTVGAAKFLTDNLPDLYAVVRGKRWSVLIESRSDPATQKILSTRRLTRIYH
jgi:hypothetical protein